MRISMTRRQLLHASVGLAVVAAGAGGLAPRLQAQGPVTAGQFLALSTSLTGAADLDPAVAATLLRGFLAAGHGATLAGLVAGSGESDPAAHRLADEIVAAWYSGLYDDGKSVGVAGYDQALLWRALAFTKPLGTCGGETGYWGDPPAG